MADRNARDPQAVHVQTSGDGGLTYDDINPATEEKQDDIIEAIEDGSLIDLITSKTNTQTDLLKEILIELRKVNIQLAMMTDEEISNKSKNL